MRFSTRGNRFRKAARTQDGGESDSCKTLAYWPPFLLGHPPWGASGHGVLGNGASAAAETIGGVNIRSISAYEN